ncbi:MAG: excinuclease ABC subunit C [Spirochaetales bacterium]|nr:excinuclease ABC subunit C [Spirochaetales bacterium]
MNDRTYLVNKIKHFPNKPGVYLMKDAAGTIIYVGKAKELKKRVQSYFSKDKDLKTEALAVKIADIDVIITGNEMQALITENHLIKKHQPKYNINLKDGKTYAVIRVTADIFPRIFRTRRLVFDGSAYFGPFPKAEEIDTYLALIEKLFPLRKCRGPFKKRSHPCIYYHIGRCSAPCSGGISRDEYALIVDKIKKLLRGDTGELIKELSSKMKQASADLEFEKAALYRDQYNAVRHITELQKLSLGSGATSDYMGVAVRDKFASFVVLKVRAGKVLGKEVFKTHVYSSKEEALSQFIFQYYAQVQEYPRAVYLPGFAERELVQAVLKDRGSPAEARPDAAARTAADPAAVLSPDTSAKAAKAAAEASAKEAASGAPGKTSIIVTVPQRGRHLAMIKMAVVNAEQDLRITSLDSLVELKIALKLADIPIRIEGFDIAHLGGTHMTASMVCFVNGRPEKSAYRKFKIKTLDGAVDDYEAMREVVARRYSRVLNEGLPQPDLILIDGGKGQLNAALAVLSTLGLGQIPIAGLAKKHEELFLPDKEEPLVLSRDSLALKLLQAVRDESHRFATTFHKKLRQKKAVLSVLEKFDGVGKAKSRMLLTAFGSLQAIADSPAAELARVARMSKTKAESLLEGLKAELGN